MKFWQWWSRRQARESDLDRELRTHIETEADEQEAAGVPPEEAQYAARRALGNTTQLKEDLRAIWGWTSIQNLLQDLRYGTRQLRRNPGFFVVATLTLALGIGANTAIFSVMNAVILRYLPAPDPQELVYLHNVNRPANTSQTGYTDDFSFTEYSVEQLRAHHPGLTAVMAFVPLSDSKVAVRYGREPEEALADMVSGNFFSGLGVAPALGHTFTMNDEKQHAQLAVLSYSYWTARFLRNPSVLGNTLYVKGVPFTIIGIAARGFFGVEPTSKTDIWIPFQNRPELKPWGRSAQDQDKLYGSLDWWFLMMIGRLAPGVTMKQAQGELDPLFRRIAYVGAGGKRGGKIQPPRLYFTPARGIEALREGYGEPLKFLMAMVGLVLVIACSNVAMLLVARNAVREREFSLRITLGAGRLRLFRQLLTESLLLVAGGAALGWLFAQWSTGALAAWSNLDVNLAPDGLVLLFALTVSALATLVFGLAPLRSALRVPPGLALKSAAARSSASRSSFRTGRIILALQTALCVVLLVAAGLLLRTLRNLENANLGMRVSGLLVFGVSPPQTLHTDRKVIQFFRTLTDRFRALPGVESVTLMQNRIGFGWANNTDAFLDGVLPRPSGDENLMRWNAVGPDYFHALGIPLLLGRDLTDADTSAASKVVVVNQTFGQRFLTGRDPLGHRLAMDGGARATQYTIVGVAADSKYRSVDENSHPMAYFPYTQIPGVATMHFELRARNNPLALLPEVRRVVRDFGPDLPLLQPMTQQEQFQESFSEQRLFARLSGFFGLLAALLVATGLYGALAYRVSRRTAEIGVRMALGARRRQVVWMVLRESLVVTLAGVLVGLPLAVGGARLLRSTLFGLQPGDPISFAAALAGLLFVTLVASFIPARRAVKVDPMVALRCE
jgi:predicted permease